jgi:hypothetical protein
VRYFQGLGSTARIGRRSSGWLRAPSAVTLLTVLVVVTLAIIFVMVAKPTLF